MQTQYPGISRNAPPLARGWNGRAHVERYLAEDAAGAVVDSPAAIRATRGFTTLELMITLAVAAVLAAIAAPSMIIFVHNNKMSTAARQLDADMLLARREAIKRNMRVLVCPIGSVAGKCPTVTATGWTQGWQVCYDADADGQCDDTATGNPNPIRKHAALDSILTLTGPAAVLRFNANGSQGAAGAASATFTTRGTWSGSTSYGETITATGNVSMAAGS
jgi:type IV fimbrial biogenesis protein FimT